MGFLEFLVSKINFQVIYWQRDLKDNFFEPTKNHTRLVHLFNMDSDPSEKSEISDQYPDLVKMGLSLLVMHNETAVVPQWPHIDKMSNPETRKDKFAGFWWPWK